MYYWVLCCREPAVKDEAPQEISSNPRHSFKSVKPLQSMPKRETLITTGKAEADNHPGISAFGYNGN